MKPCSHFFGAGAQCCLLLRRVPVVGLAAACFSLPAVTVLAAEEAARQPTHPADILWGLLPILVIGVILWLFLRKTQRSPFMQRSAEHYEKVEQHMQRVEQLAERIAVALEKRDKSGG